jgi:hypothetical protein
MESYRSRSGGSMRSNLNGRKAKRGYTLDRGGWHARQAFDQTDRKHGRTPSPRGHRPSEKRPGNVDRFCLPSNQRPTVPTHLLSKPPSRPSSLPLFYTPPFTPNPEATYLRSLISRPIASPLDQPFLIRLPKIISVSPSTITMSSSTCSSPSTSASRRGVKRTSGSRSSSASTTAPNGSSSSSTSASKASPPHDPYYGHEETATTAARFVSTRPPPLRDGATEHLARFARLSARRIAPPRAELCFLSPRHCSS